MLLTLLGLQAVTQSREFLPPHHITSTAQLRKALGKEYVYSSVREISSGDCQVVVAIGGRTSGITVRDVLVYMNYKPRGIQRGKILVAHLPRRAASPEARIIRTDGGYSLRLQYPTKSKKKVSETISLSLFHPLYRPF